MNHLSKYSTLLTEAASSLLYHYLNIGNLYELLKYNRFRTCEPERYITNSEVTPEDDRFDYINGKDIRYISLTRNPNPNEGYPIIKYGEFGDGDLLCVCRLTVDGDALNTYCNFKDGDNRQQNMKVKPIDWAYYDMARDYGGYPNGKEWMMNSKDSMYTDYLGGKFDVGDKEYSDKYHHPYSQAEDRILTKAEYIPNANKYIKYIDIFVRENQNSLYNNTQEEYNKEMEFLKKIKLGARRLKIPLKIHSDINDFTSNYNM